MEIRKKIFFFVLRFPYGLNLVKENIKLYLLKMREVKATLFK